MRKHRRSALCRFTRISLSKGSWTLPRARKANVRYSIHWSDSVAYRAKIPPRQCWQQARRVGEGFGDRRPACSSEPRLATSVQNRGSAVRDGLDYSRSHSGHAPRTEGEKYGEVLPDV